MKSLDRSVAAKRRRQIRADRILLAAQFPACFAPACSSQPKRPLKLNIHIELFAAGLIGNDGEKIALHRVRKALNDYCSGPKYAAALAAGGDRIDLKGNLVGRVTEIEQRSAIERIRNLGWEEKCGVAARKAA